MLIEYVDDFPQPENESRYNELYESLSGLDIDGKIRVNLKEHKVSNLRTKISTYARSNARKFQTRVKDDWLYVKRVEIEWTHTMLILASVLIKP